MTSQIKAIVFDLGGVFFKEGKAYVAEKLAQEKGYLKKTVLNILRSPKSFDLRAGLITDEEFWSHAQQQLPPDYDAQTIKSYWYDSYILDKAIFNLVKKLYGKYRLIIFSGNIKSRVEYLEKKYGFRKYFDLEVYSFDCHCNKSEEEFVEKLLEKSGLGPKEIVYIDDSLAAAKPALDLGVNTVIYTAGKIEELEEKLRSFGIDF